MNRYRNIPGLRPSSQATQTTVCQKCLKRDMSPTMALLVRYMLTDGVRHYSYECKAGAQERPYQSRPSRTQQLANPRLRPQLSADVPDDFRKSKATTDRPPTPRAEEQRGRKREAIDDGESDTRDASRKRARSISAYSSSSVSTISTGRSRSPTPQSRRDPSRSPFKSENRKRRMSQSPSDESDFSDLYSEATRSRSGRKQSPDRYTRRKRQSRSPSERGRRYDTDRRGSWRTRSRSESMDRSRIAKGRRSLTPGPLRKDRNGARSHERRGNRDNPPPSRTGDRQHTRTDEGMRKRESPPLRERSLSPYSKRLALTQAMNTGQ